MQIYKRDSDTVRRWQWNDPALRNLSDVVLGLLGNIPDKGAKRVLDLGCGTGRLAAQIGALGFTVDGIDPEARAVSTGNAVIRELGLTGVSLHAGDVFDDRSPVAGGGYDVLVCTEVLEHVDDWRALLARGLALVRNGGRIIISVPRDPAQFGVLDEYAGHLRRFREPELLGALAGCADIEVARLGAPLFRSFVWLYGRALKLLRRPHASQTESMWGSPSLTARLYGALMYGMLKFDNVFKGLPWGATLVVSARKL